VNNILAGTGNQTLYATPDAASWQTGIGTALARHVVIVPPPNPLGVVTGNLTSGGTTVSGLLSTAALFVGEAISTTGVGLQAGTTITAILSNSSVTIAKPATANLVGAALVVGDPKAEFTLLKAGVDALSAQIFALLNTQRTPAQALQFQSLLSEYQVVLQEQNNLAALLGGTTFGNTLVGGAGNDTFYSGAGPTKMGGGTGS
jgi:hypothetical protein